MSDTEEEERVAYSLALTVFLDVRGGIHLNLTFKTEEGKTTGKQKLSRDILKRRKQIKKAVMTVWDMDTPLNKRLLSDYADLVEDHIYQTQEQMIVKANAKGDS